MTNGNGSTSHDEGSTSRFSGVARGGADMFRRAFSVAAQEEINQVRQEAVGRLTPAAQSSGMILGGGILAACGGVYLLQAVVGLLATRMPRWLASLLTATALLLGGAVLLERGRSQLKEAATPSEDDEAQA